MSKIYNSTILQQSFRTPSTACVSKCILKVFIMMLLSYIKFHSLRCSQIFPLPDFPFRDPYAFLMMNGCLNASLAVHLFSGFRFRQRSSRSMNRLRSLASASPIPLPAVPRTLLLRSRVGFVNGKMRTTS